MTTYEVGQTITWGLTTYDSAGAPANVGTMGSATITRPDGTTTTVTPSNTGTGTYQAAIASTMAGRWRCQFTGSGANSGALPWTDVADVWPADPRLIISLADAKAELNHVTDVNDDELRLYIAATTPIVEEIAGRVLVATVTETFDGGRRAVLLSERASAITSVTVDGAALAASAYTADLTSGIVYAGGSSTPSTFSWGRQNVVVVYTVGAAAIDPNVVQAARVITAHMYKVGQQRKGKNAQADDIVIASGYAVPKRALELLRSRSSYRMPGMA